MDKSLMSLLKQKADVYKKNLQSLKLMCKDLVTIPLFTEPEETYVNLRYSWRLI